MNNGSKDEICFLIYTSPAGSLLAVKLHSENRVIFNGKYEILISLILQWQDNPRKTMRNQLFLIIGICGLRVVDVCISLMWVNNQPCCSGHFNAFTIVTKRPYHPGTLVEMVEMQKFVLN